MKEIVFTEQAPTPIGPYNQAVIARGGLIFTAGQIPVDPQTGHVMHGDIDGQTHQVLTNLKHVLEAGGSSMDRVVKTTVFLTDLGDFARMNEMYGRFFPEDRAPARSTVQVSRLPKDVRVEIEAVAVV